MKHLFFLFIFAISVACTSTPNRFPAGTGKPRHIVITVHGLSGNENTWGYFAPATKSYLESIDPNYEVTVSNFLYPTGRSETLTVFDFAESLNAYVEALFEKAPLRPQDKISFVAHSQGGIISYIWFFSKLMKGREDYKFVRHVDAIITLGTPFWGSKLASIMTDPSRPDIIPFIKAFGGPEYQMSRREIMDLALGSDTVHNFRSLAIELDSDPEFARKIKTLPVRLVNISGVLPQDKKKLYANSSTPAASKLAMKLIDLIYQTFTRKGFGDTRVESDIAVIVPSARWDFIYTEPKKVSGDLKISQTDFHQFKNLVEKSKFLFTETVHLPFDTENTLSMAYINQSCLQVETCNHPTYRYILEQLVNCKANNCQTEQYANIIQKMKVVNLDQHKFNNNLQQSLQAFNIQIGIKLNAGQINSFPVNYFKKKTDSIDGTLEIWTLNEPTLIGKVFNLKRDKNQVSSGSNHDHLIYIGKKDETQSIDIVSKPATTEVPFDQLRINITGSMQRKEGAPLQGRVPMEIHLPGLPKVEAEVLIQPGYSTYFELDYRK